ncbi:50S ribosomal protein L11 methyltransferase [Deferribacterales bacterium Es71-Z0220]|jgi:ribosomal protein L11 methyltransferase|uniref:50S ribosomal protein L11 methyltransferase n=1 Tax=Deferrivibrio essentukiensis TaxID=2880922 RepID=UPI001F60A28A|nr:50S ribosomal protein L11 methyltransferase [Deferrivibrio essentukiensis]MBZ4672590.1 ribosomal methyltransferase [Deferribacteraceae bacterium]MCB4204106.1 50S ribosomal protein L11 methyltransferase [Deferrivibrio essentukiensis]
MYEYRLKIITDELEASLKLLDIDIIEEDIYSQKEYIFYSDKKLSDLLESMNLDFVENNVDNLGWQEKWKEYLKPGLLTENVKYIFDEKDKVEGKKSILINPSLAFGTGNHPTTKIAAMLLEELSCGKIILDVGCGSGILSILASISGSVAVYGFDVDKVALSNTSENIALNKCDNIYVWAGGIDSIKQNITFDVVCANIISSVLLNIKDKLFSHAEKYLIVSGILINEKDNFLEKFRNNKFNVLKQMEMDNWFGAVFERVNF